MNAISYGIPQSKKLFREMVELGSQNRKTQDIPFPFNASARKAQAFKRERVIKRLQQLPPKVIISDFDQTITSVKSNRDYYEEFKKVRAEKNPILLREYRETLSVHQGKGNAIYEVSDKLPFKGCLLIAVKSEVVAIAH